MNISKDNYFLKTNAFIEGNSYLRKVQREAYKRLKEEFELDCRTHKIIVLPTGAGKTGLIGIAPYEISEGRVLVITPSLIIREGISDAFDTRTILNFWSDKKIILDDENLPNVYRYAGYKTPGDKKRVLQYLEDANIVIANIHKISSENSSKTLIDILPPNFFDMIIIDEAHHSEAISWKNTLEYFECTKILKLTATPFRADEKELDGKIIYTYPLADAIKDGIIKNLVAEDYTTEKLEFKINGTTVSKEDALKEMDKSWVTRSVAYSEQCNRTIIERSIERLNEKRKQGNALHQIIAVACSIEHAQQIKELYEEYNLKAEYVSSDRMEESEQIIVDLKKGNIDVVVNVDMLGEGFDHPPLSIAAIFRPFRTLSPYAQFIGRILRKIQGDNIIDEIDNVAHVVYHKELDLDELWKYYSNQKKQSISKRLIEVEFSQDGTERSREIGEVTTGGEVITTVRTFLQDNINSTYSQAIKNEIEKFEQALSEDKSKLRLAGMSEEAVQDFEKARRKTIEDKVNLRREEMRAELIREELQARHLNDIINRVSCLFEETKMSPDGTELPQNTTSPILKGARDNKAYVRIYINDNLKRKLKRGIDEWETYDFKQAELLIPEIIQRLKVKLKKLGDGDNE